MPITISQLHSISESCLKGGTVDTRGAYVEHYAPSVTLEITEALTEATQLLDSLHIELEDSIITRISLPDAQAVLHWQTVTRKDLEL